jgi:hypothetical protein
MLLVHKLDIEMTPEKCSLTLRSKLSHSYMKNVFYLAQVRNMYKNFFISFTGQIRSSNIEENDEGKKAFVCL